MLDWIKQRIQDKTMRFEKHCIKDDNRMSGHVKYQRIIYIPNEFLKNAHKWFLQELYYAKSRFFLKYAYGVKGKTLLEHVRKHLANRYFYLIDIHNAFGSVSFVGLLCILLSIGKWKAQKSELIFFLKHGCFISFPEKEKLFTKYGHKGLMQGMPTSPFLFNIYAGEYLDKALEEICRKHKLTYSRFIDDLIFSRNGRPITKGIRKKIRRVILNAKMEISHHKCEVLDRKKGEIKLNGIRLKDDNTLGVSKTWMTKLRGLLHTATRDDRAVVEGHMALFKHVTKNREMTSTEQKIADAYSKYAEQFIYKKKSCLPAYVTLYNRRLDFGPDQI